MFRSVGGIAVKSVAFTARHMQLTMVSIINLFMAAHKINVPRWPDRRCTRSSMALSNVFLAPLPGGFHPRIDCARTADHGFDARRLWKYLWNGNSLLYIQKEEWYTYVSLNHCSLLSSTASGLSSFADKLSGVMHGMVSAPASASPNRFKGYCRRTGFAKETQYAKRLRPAPTYTLHLR